MVRQGQLIAVVGTFLIRCAILLVGSSEVRAEASQEEKQGHTEATTEQAHSGRAASKEDRCEGTRMIVRDGEGYLTNDIPGCPKGGLLSDTGASCGCALDGMKGDDEIHGRSTGDELYGGTGSDVIYGGANWDFLYSAGLHPASGHESDKDVLHGGDGPDNMYGGKGADVFYGGDGNDDIVAAALEVDYGADKQRDKLYCGDGRDYYYAGRLDYVDSSCEEGKLVDTGGPPLILLAGAALLLLSSGLVMGRYVIRRAS